MSTGNKVLDELYEQMLKEGLDPLKTTQREIKKRKAKLEKQTNIRVSDNVEHLLSLKKSQKHHRIVLRLWEENYEGLALIAGTDDRISISTLMNLAVKRQLLLLYEEFLPYNDNLDQKVKE